MICPSADLKLYITASDDVRASRRHKELIDKGVAAIYAEILADLKARDQRDQSRSAAPSRPADDAIVSWIRPGCRLKLCLDKALWLGGGSSALKALNSSPDYTSASLRKEVFVNRPELAWD